MSSLKQRLHEERKARLRRIELAATKVQQKLQLVVQEEVKEPEVEVTPPPPQKPLVRDWIIIDGTLKEYEPGMTTVFKVKMIIHECCYQTNTSWIDLKSNRRSKDLMVPRHYLMWRLRHETTMSLPQIGKYLGGRDHTTVLHGVRKYQRMVDAGTAPYLPPTARKEAAE